MCRPFALYSAAVGLILLAVVFGAVALSGPARASHAGGMSAMSIDMDTAGNTATALGTRESCAVVSPGDAITIDVTATDIPASNPMIAFSYRLNSPAAVVTVQSASHAFLLASTAGSSVIDVSNPLPDASGSWVAGVVDLSDSSIIRESGSGVLSRISLSINGGAAPGLYALSLSDAAHIDPLNVGLLPDAVDNAFIAVSGSCDELPTPTPTTTPGPCDPPPANDEIANATAVGPLPFFDSTDTSCGTTAIGDPFCSGQGPTAWYRYTPSANGAIQANTFGSGYDTTLSAYTGTPGSLNQIACNDDSGSLQSMVTIPVFAGETYFFMVGSFFSGPGGSLQFTVQEVIPLEIDVTIDPRGSVIPRDGVATVRGTYSCTKPAEMQIFGELRQRSGRAVVSALFSANFFCEGYGAWEAEAVPSGERYAGGRAAAQLEAVGFTFSEVAFDEAAGDVLLAGTKPQRQTRCPHDGNAGFEAGAPDSNAIPCWTVADMGNGSWCTQAGALSPAGDCFGSGLTVAPPPEGAQAAMAGQAGPGAHVLYRCGVLRSGAIGFQLYILNDAGAFASPPTLDPFGVENNQQVRVDLVRSGALAADPFTTAPGDVLMNVYQSQPGDPLESGYAAVSADAGAYVRQEVCLRFAEADNLFFLHAGVDAVQVDWRAAR